MESLTKVVSLLVVALGIMSTVCPFLIEILKGVFCNLIKNIGKEYFAIVITMIFGFFVYLFLLLFFKDIMFLLSILQIIFIFIVWEIVCAVCSQNCYDKVIKWIMNLISRGK